MTLIRLGPGGNVAETTEASIEELHRLGLKAQELEFVRQVFLKPEPAKEVGQIAKKLDVKLSIHASYFINLSSEEKAKVEASKQRILASCKIANIANAEHVVFHPGYYGKRTPEDTYIIVKKQVLDLMNTLKRKEWSNVKLAVETAGKLSQFGSLDELCKLANETGCTICTDFAHLLARTNGQRDYKEIFTKLKQFDYLHCHFAGIEYTEKGERRHLLCEKKDIKELLQFALKSNKNMTIINESPDPLGDTLKTKKILETLR